MDSQLNYIIILFFMQSSVGNAAKKPKKAVASVFGNDSDEE